MLKYDFLFRLTTPVHYHQEGQVVEAGELTVFAPSNQNRRYAAPLKQAYFRAIHSATKMLKDMGSDKSDSKEVEKESKPEEMATQILTLMNMSDVDMAVVEEEFKKLLVNGTCFVKHTEQMKVQFTELHYKELSYEDTDRLMGLYLVNFLVPSWMNQAMGK